MDEATKRNLAARTIAVVGVVAAALCGLEVVTVGGPVAGWEVAADGMEIVL